VPLVQSIGISAGILNNSRMANALKAWRRASSAAKDRAAAGAHGVFPPLASHLLTVGEETGKLD
jgi:type II secretory pathway component PulF